MKHKTIDTEKYIIDFEYKDNDGFWKQKQTTVRFRLYGYLNPKDNHALAEQCFYDAHSSIYQNIRIKRTTYV